MTVPQDTFIQEAPARGSAARYLRQPLWLSVMILIVAASLWAWTAGRTRTAQEIARRNTQNAARAKRAARALATLVPPQLTGDAGQKISALVDHALKSASVPDRQLRTQSIHTLGAVGQTSVSKQQAHVEISNVSLEQAAKILQTVEGSGEPVWIESSDLTATSQDRWNLVLDIDWLQKPPN